MLNALTRSINIPAVRVADRVGRQKIVETMRKMGVTSEIIISAPLPLGAADLTVIEHTRAYAHFASGGLAVDSHAAIELRTPLGEVIWNHDRDSPKRAQVLTRQAVEDMNMMLHNAVENGTGRRARIDGFFVTGKTGTTNAYRDAWFMGYTGNFVGGIWVGNDDYRPTQRMTGGSLPAMIWQRAMQYAHQGVEPAPVPGLKGTPPSSGIPVAINQNLPERRPTTLNARSMERLLRLEKVLREAPPPPPPPLAGQADRRAESPGGNLR
jgi:penicillin-binding protein 1A